MKSQNQSFDVLISGGGLSGCLMALSLAGLTKADGRLLSIAMVESNQSATDNSPAKAKLFDDRVLALSHGSAAYLKNLGVWQHINTDACAIEKNRYFRSR